MGSAAFARSARILERMINQNTFDDVLLDFKFWEDESDEFRPNEGSCLPLWSFASDEASRRPVTALKWNPAHPDLFAVGYGTDMQCLALFY